MLKTSALFKKLYQKVIMRHGEGTATVESCFNSGSIDIVLGYHVTIDNHVFYFVIYSDKNKNIKSVDTDGTRDMMRNSYCALVNAAMKKYHG